MTLLTVVVLLTVATATAWAGGSWLTADRYEVVPGEVVTVTGEAYPGQQGWVEDGPFRLALRPEGEPYGFGARPGDVPVGALELSPAGSVLRVRASVTIPAIAPGSYELVYCDRTCSDGLGDLIGLDRPLTVAAGGAHADREQPADREQLVPPWWALLLTVAAALAVVMGTRATLASRSAGR